MQSASLIEKHQFFFYTKTMIDLSFLVSAVFTPVLGVPDALHTAVAPEIWIDQSGFNRWENSTALTSNAC